MSYGLWGLVIFLTFVAGMLGLGFWMTRHDQDADTRDEAQARRTHPVYRPKPFPVDTDPLLLLSEAAAAVEAHEREVQAMIRRADQLGMTLVDGIAVRTADAAPQDQL